MIRTLIAALICITTSNAFCVQECVTGMNNKGHSHVQFQKSVLLSQQYAYSKREEEQEDVSSSYDTSEASSKGIVSTLTGVVNFIMGKDEERDLDVRSNEGVLPFFLFLLFLFERL